METKILIPMDINNVKVLKKNKIFGRKSVHQITCTRCHQLITTRVKSNTFDTGLMAAWFCLFGCWLTSLLVCCGPGFRKFIHSCPKCNTVLGTHKPTLSRGQNTLILILSIIFWPGLLVAGWPGLLVVGCWLANVASCWLLGYCFETQDHEKTNNNQQKQGMTI